MFLLVMYLFNSSPSPSNNPVNLPDDIVPLSDGIQYHASFYLFNPTGFSPTFTNVTPELCDFLGEGAVTFHDDVYNDPDSINQLIVKAPDYSSVVPSDMGVQWGSLYKYNDDICVIGLLSDEISAPKADNTPSLPDGYINVCDYGMKGDGSFDNSAAFRALISSYSKLYFPSGQYLFKSAIAIQNSVDLKGNSADTTSLLFDNSDNSKPYNFQVLCDNFSAKGLSFILNKTEHYSNKSNIGSTLIKIGMTNNCNFEKCIFKTDESTPYFYNAFWINTDNGPVSNVDIENCSFINDGNEEIGGTLWIFACNYPIRNVSVNNCSFSHTGWDENIAIWSNAKAQLDNISVTNCSIKNTNNIVSSDNIIAVYSPSQGSTVTIFNNHFEGTGRIATSIKLRGAAGNIVFDSNTVNISNTIDPSTTFGNLLWADAPNLRFTNNNITVSEAFPARLKLDNIGQFDNNTLSVNAKSLRIEDANASTRSTARQLNNNNLSISASILDVCTPISYNGGSISFNTKTNIYLPSPSSSFIINNSKISGKANVVFDSKLSNQVQILGGSTTDTITSNNSERLLTK